MNGDAGSVDIPAVMIGPADADLLLDALAAGDEVRVELARGTFVALSESGNQMADFSSRGPALSDRNFLKPDVTAPGVDILAGTTPTPANGLQGETFQYFTGTSQAAPEVTGVAILLKEAHPDWSPGVLKSALMTSAYQGVVNSDGEAATPFDRGSGHIDANRANDPGLVYANEFRDHAAYLCGLLEPAFPPADCTALAAAGFSSEPTDLNLPSIAVARLITGDTVKRRVTNVGPPASYSATVTPPQDVDVIVDPPSLVLGTGQTGEFTVRFVDNGAPLDQWDFGELKWTDDTHTVVSPIAVQPVALRVPLELKLRGRSGSTTLPIAFGYSGPYTARSHGLRAPFRDAVTGQVPTGFVDDDPTNTFRFPGGNGLALQGINVPAGPALSARGAVRRIHRRRGRSRSLSLLLRERHDRQLHANRAKRRLHVRRGDRHHDARARPLRRGRARLRDGPGRGRPRRELLACSRGRSGSRTTSAISTWRRRRRRWRATGSIST